MHKDNSLRHLGFSFHLPKNFSEVDQGKIAMACDNIILQKIALEADYDEQNWGIACSSERNMQSLEQRIKFHAEAELKLLIDMLVSLVPDISAEGLAASLYHNFQFFAPYMDGYEEGDTIDFIEGEHGKLTADYYDCLESTECHYGRNPDIHDDTHQKAAQISLANYLIGCTDIENTDDFHHKMNSYPLDALTKTYERVMYLRNLCDDCGENLDRFHKSYAAYVEQVIDNRVGQKITPDTDHAPKLPAP